MLDVITPRGGTGQVIIGSDLGPRRSC